MTLKGDPKSFPQLSKLSLGGVLSLRSAGAVFSVSLSPVVMEVSSSFLLFGLHIKSSPHSPTDSFRDLNFNPGSIHALSWRIHSTSYEPSWDKKNLDTDLRHDKIDKDEERLDPTCSGRFEAVCFVSFL